jgi:hypothetical protein
MNSKPIKMISDYTNEEVELSSDSFIFVKENDKINWSPY